MRGPDATPGTPLAATPTADPKSVEEIVDSWLPLTYALNAVNRSMGKEDLYPFYLSVTVLDMLRFVHDAVTRGRSAPPAGTP